MSDFRIEKLQRSHPVDGSDCGREALNRFLTRYAFQNQQAGAANTYVALNEKEDIVGYYTLVVAEVQHDDAPRAVDEGPCQTSRTADVAGAVGR